MIFTSEKQIVKPLFLLILDVLYTNTARKPQKPRFPVTQCHTPIRRQTYQ